MPIRLDQILGEEQATPQSPGVPQPAPGFSPYPGLELQGVTMGGKTPTMRFGQPKAAAASKSLASSIQRDLSRIASFEGSLNDLEALVKTVPKGRVKGWVAGAKSFVTGGGEGLGLDAASSRSIMTYNQMRPGIAAGLYRAVTGDDRISDLDAAARALPFVPPLNIDPKAFEERLTLIKRAIQRRKQSIEEAAKTGGTTPPGDLSMILDTEELPTPDAEDFEILNVQ